MTRKALRRDADGLDAARVERVDTGQELEAPPLQVANVNGTDAQVAHRHDGDATVTEHGVRCNACVHRCCGIHRERDAAAKNGERRRIDVNVLPRLPIDEFDYISAFAGVLQSATMPRTSFSKSNAGTAGSMGVCRHEPADDAFTASAFP